MWAQTQIVHLKSFGPILTVCPRTSHLELGISPAFVLGLSLLLASTAFRLSAYQALGQMFTFQLSIVEKHHLVTSGPYSIVRHPAYTGSIGCALGALICMLSDGSWLRECYGKESIMTSAMRVVVGVWVGFWIWLISVFVRRTRREDEMMEETFGNQWTGWRSKVKYRLVPGLF
jgi:protein-S-isoprenylcysteine O-methyltransferase Ste14